MANVDKIFSFILWKAENWYTSQQWEFLIKPE